MNGDAGTTMRTTPVTTHFRLTDGVVLGFAAELILLPTGLVTAAVLTRTLGPRGYGASVRPMGGSVGSPGCPLPPEEIPCARS